MCFRLTFSRHFIEADLKTVRTKETLEALKTISENRNQKVKTRRSLQEGDIVYLDPLFKIPVVRKAPFIAERKSSNTVSLDRRKENTTKVIEDNYLSVDKRKILQQQQQQQLQHQQHEHQHQQKQHQQQQQKQQQQKQQQPKQQQQRWRPYSFNNVASQRRCRMFSEDCSIKTDDPCCQYHQPLEDRNNVDRFYPIGPYVQAR